MAKVAAAAHTPFIAGASPTVMQMDTWQELANPRDLTKIFTTPDYASWRSLRESDDARYLGLAMPRYLSRLPYGAKTSPVEEFDFEEDTGAADHSRYTWANAAYAMAVNINRSFKLYGWCSRIRGIESGGSVEGLPTHTFPPRTAGRHEMSDGNRHQRPARGGTCEERLHAADPSQEQRCGGVHRRAVAEQTCGVRRSRCDGECQPGGAPALHVCLLPFRALFEVHRAGQGRFLQRAATTNGYNWINTSTATPQSSKREGAQALARRVSSSPRGEP
jgi:hypothetical protein